MNAETDLQTLIASMKPALHAQPYVFCSIDQAVSPGSPSFRWVRFTNGKA
ncbi:ACT domain-containing protein [Desulfonatronum thiosulfatophilum]